MPETLTLEALEGVQLRLAKDTFDGERRELFVLLLGLGGKSCCCCCCCLTMFGGPGPLGVATAPPHVAPFEKEAPEVEEDAGKFRSNDTLGTMPEFMMSL